MGKYTVKDYGVKFGCHVKTILRAMTNDPAPSDWHDDEKYDVADVALVFQAPSMAALERVMRGQDDLVPAEAAAKQMNICLRQFHNRQNDGTGPAKALNHKRIVRYLVSDIDCLDI